ncbi:hypothetical protein M9H77_06555 [Catharanthus roseus]|uniref:Uncharacterized protein n=1 Tax=Catharanthus roseus TaxID=4058 RepID=A0ACC0BSE2_CATRO|nr:hypothetical protein M9H77_06555 [Catharanthus roseus]
MPCLKDKPASDSPPNVPTPGSIPVEVEVTSEPSLEPTQEHETNEELVTPSSSILDPPSIPETLNPVLEDSDEEEEHPEAQAQALRDYQLARNRVRRVPKEHPRYAHFLIPMMTHGPQQKIR